MPDRLMARAGPFLDLVLTTPRQSRGRAVRVPARACALIVSLAATFVSFPAAASYEEAHVIGDEVRLTVGTNGSARVEHTVAWQVVAGQYHFFDLTAWTGTLPPEAGASVTSEDGRIFPATLAAREGDVLRVTFEEPKGLHHGHYKIRFAYQEDFVKSHAFSREGAMWRLTWKSPTFSEGYDGARVIFDLPPSLDEPRLVDAPDELVGLGVLSTFHRADDKDELELVKPHVARHEVLTWTLRVAPRAFPGIRDPSLRPRPPAPPLTVRRGFSPVVLLLGALAAGLIYGVLAWKKAMGFDRMCRELGVRAEGLLPVALDLRAALSGTFLGAGIFVEGAGAPTWGGGCIAMAMLLSVSRPPAVRAAPPRGPGRWLALRPTEAFHERRGSDGFDPATLPGACAGVAALALLTALGGFLSRFDPHAPLLVALDSVALLPLVATGRRSQLPLHARSRVGWLGRLFKRLTKEPSLRVAPWVRVPTGCVEPDEVRVLVVPRAAMPGLVGIEVGLSSWHSGTCYGASPEVLVRVHESTAASARMTTLATFVRPMPGRLPEERVFRLAPRLPTRDGAALLVRRLGRELEDRRFAMLHWERDERRLPPSLRERPLAGAA
jgi:hypothetical protein